MKEVKIHLRNIQSHENTEFTLKPGLNFILSDDNNVGKSTIFKILLFAAKMPNVKSDDAEELMRGGCSEAYASFSFDTNTVILWFHKENNKAYRNFFEIRQQGNNTIRAVTCPDILLEALDFVLGTDGQVINFNTADTVQLVAQDTPKNDEVLSKVLIDLRVERIKKNFQELSKRIYQDYRVHTSRAEDTERLLKSLTYLDITDSFHSDEKLLETAARVTDSLVESINMPAFTSHPASEELSELLTVYKMITVCSQIVDAGRATLSEIQIEDLKTIQAAYKVLRIFDGIDLNLIGWTPEVTSKTISNMKRAVTLLNSLTGLMKFIVTAELAARDIEKLDNQRQQILSQLHACCKVVKCPVKGDVFYNDEKCISTGN